MKIKTKITNHFTLDFSFYKKGKRELFYRNRLFYKKEKREQACGGCGKKGNTVHCLLVEM